MLFSRPFTLTRIQFWQACFSFLARKRPFEAKIPVIGDLIWKTSVMAPKHPYLLSPICNPTNNTFRLKGDLQNIMPWTLPIPVYDKRGCDRWAMQIVLVPCINQWIIIGHLWDGIWHAWNSHMGHLALSAQQWMKADTGLRKQIGNTLPTII